MWIGIALLKKKSTTYASLRFGVGKLTVSELGTRSSFAETIRYDKMIPN